MVWDNYAPIRRHFLSKNNVAAALTVMLVSNLSQCLHNFTTRNARQDTHV